MATEMRAAVTLKLVDQMSPALRKCLDLVKQFQALMKRTGWKELDGADATVRQLGKDIGGVNTQLGTTVRQAEAAASAIRRMGSAELARTRAAVAQGGQLRQQIGRGAGIEQIYGPGGMPLMAGGPRFVPSEEGASSRMGMRGRMGNGMARAREGIGQLSESVGLMGGALAGISLEAPIHQAAELDQVLRQVAIIQHKTGADAEAEITRLRRSMGAEAMATGQPIQRLAEAYKFLLTTGMSAGTVDQLMPIHAKAASAYNVDSDTMGQAVFALHDSMKIGHDEMGGALASMAQATQEAHFDMASMSRYLPSIAGRMNALGMTGRGSADKAFAALETVVKNSADPAQAATNFQDMLIAMTQPYAVKAFKKVGVDLPGMFRNAAKAGIDPMEAYLNTLDRMTKGITDPVQKMIALGKVLHNQQAGTAALSLLQHRDEYKRMRDELHGIGADKMDADYKTSMEGLKPALALRSARTEMLEQRVGMGFAWTVPASSALLGGVLEGLKWMDDHLPGMAGAAIALTGGMLGLVAVLGVLGAVSGPIKAGAQVLRFGSIVRGVFSRSALRLLINPWTAILLGVGLAAYDIWTHWDRFRGKFTAMWGGLKQAAGGFGEFMAGLFRGDNERAANGVVAMLQGVGRAWRVFWGKDGIMATLLQDFSNWVDTTWAAGLLTGFGRVISQSIEGWRGFVMDLKAMFATIQMPQMNLMVPQGGPDSFPTYRPPAPVQPDGRSADHESHAMPALRHPSAYRLQAPTAAPVQNAAWDGHITISADPSLKVAAQSGDERVRFTQRPADRGRMLNRA